jgi:hypothetical protein
VRSSHTGGSSPAAGKCWQRCEYDARPTRPLRRSESGRATCVAAAKPLGPAALAAVAAKMARRGAARPGAQDLYGGAGQDPPDRGGAMPTAASEGPIGYQIGPASPRRDGRSADSSARRFLVPSHCQV